ncbi:GntR family transcriptional regulator [Parvularcula lutaonensis]|uniref:GntR family transcriptional regulator n=1 Tax=Parvularcula lutaonensis TaxID=491923 RepID=A0ABV7MAV7_9PROT|nr:GntR family transcriptional regulator [Parvularcula lutaonensis]GGY38730.1 GntR family transcriptional regulator [Parvularcula lutaonensis]
MTQPLKLTPAMLDEGRATPLYQQVYDLLREKIADGTLGVNDRLPAEAELTQQLGVSRITVKRAMNELATAGLVRRQRGIGTVVTYDASAPMIRGSFDTMIDGLTRMGLDTEVQLLDCTPTTASAAVCEALDLPQGAIVQRIVRVRRLEGEPLSYLVTHVPEDIAETYDEEELASASLISLLERAGHAPVEAEQTISAVPAEAAVAVNLGVSKGSPLLKIHRIMRDAAGRPVQDITAQYRADRFEYRMRLNREGTGNSDWVAKQ